MNTSTVVTILWDMQIHTDREMSANKSDIVIKDHANHSRPVDKYEGRGYVTVQRAVYRLIVLVPVDDTEGISAEQ